MEELIKLIASRGVVDKITEILEDSFGAENVEVKWSSDFNVENFIDGYFAPTLESRGINVGTEVCTYIKENCFEDFYDALIHCCESVWNVLPEFQATIRFPNVTVTNEYGESTDLENVFIIVTFLTNGLVRPGLSLFKTTFTFPHFIHGYVHSHRPTAYTSSSSIDEVVNALLAVESCCLGDGPINQTFNVLTCTYSEEQWIALCWDIQKYVETESLTGGPYIKLTQGREVVNKRNNFILARGESRNDYIAYNYNNKLHEFLYSYSDKYAGILLDNFIKYLMENKLIQFSFDNGTFTIRTSPVETYCIISTELLKFLGTIDWSNVEPEMADAISGIRNSMHKTVCDITGIYTTEDFSAWEEKREKVLEKNAHITFKGQEIPLVIEEAPEEIDSTKYFNSVGPIYVWYVVYRILSILNLNYGLNR